MTIRQIINTLIQQGHSITYYQRKDGGILIRSIDGQRYIGAKGNLVARSMIGTTLSEKRTKQLVEATRTKKSLKKYKDLDELKKEWRRVREIWRKAFPSSKRHKNPIGQFTWKRIRWSYTQYGLDEALRRIKEAEQYASGFAYQENVDQLISYIQSYRDKLSNKNDKNLLNDLIKEIDNKRFTIKESAIKPIYDVLYDLDKGVPVEEIVRRIKRILEL